ncbi:MAG: hypothetical protein ABR540_08235 [Acidimicrobiales bacterium]
MTWSEAPPTLGEAHEGFFYPDPLGFWTEVRRWSCELLHRYQPTWGVAEALALTSLLHLEKQPERFRRAAELMQPRVVLFLDEPSWERAGLSGVHREPHFIHDPHRKRQVYEGFWGHDEAGLVVGKSPQHPATHNLYRAEDMLGFLRSAPVATGV